MAYNADGSDFFVLAQTLSDKFEKAYSKLLQDHGLTPSGNSMSSAAGGGGTGMLPQANDVSLEDKRSFAKSLYTITKDDLGKILVTLDEKCPAALIKNSAEDEVELNVDKITQDVFAELVQFVASCQANNGNSSNKSDSGGSKAKSKSGGSSGSGSSRPATKKSKTN